MKNYKFYLISDFEHDIIGAETVQASSKEEAIMIVNRDHFSWDGTWSFCHVTDIEEDK